MVEGERMTMLTRIPLEERALKKAWTDKGIKCFCCRDSGLVIDYIAAKYLIPGYTRYDAPVMCQRIRCDGSHAWLDVEGAQRRLRRYNPDYLDTRATPEVCEDVHQRELARIEALHQEAQEGPSKVRDLLSNPARILPSVPALPPQADDEINF
jgi:hypothetical protein